MNQACIYLVPSILDKEGISAIPPYITGIIHQCQVIFTENLRTTRRYMKKLDKTISINDKEWFVIDDQKSQKDILAGKLKEGKVIAVFSEAGCPGIADPGRLLVAQAHKLQARVIPLAGPSSILLSLMASGMNGQQFCFNGYLPIKEKERALAIRQYESLSAKNQSTQIFIETPYRNLQLFSSLCRTCRPETSLCIAAALTGSHEWIRTKKIEDWRKTRPDLHKIPAVFLLNAG